MKRYWKLISLSLFTIVVWAGFFIQSIPASGNQPEFVIKNQDDQKELGNHLVVSGDYSGNGNISEFLTISEEGSDYFSDRSYLSQQEMLYANPGAEQLIKDYRNFMRGKGYDLKSFYQDDTTLAYVDIDFDISFRGYESFNPSFQIDLLDKETKDRTTFELKLPKNSNFDYGDILFVQLKENELQVVASLSSFDHEKGIDREEYHLFAIDVDQQKLINDELILENEENTTESQSEWPSIDVISAEMGEKDQKYIVFVKSVQEAESLPNGEEKVIMKDSQFISYNLDSKEQSKLDLSEELQPEDYDELFHVEGNTLYFSKVENNELNISSYDISKQIISSEQTFSTPEGDTEESTYYDIEYGYLIIADRYITNDSEASIIIYDLKSAEKVYDGEISADDKMKADKGELAIHNIDFSVGLNEY